MHDFNFSVAAYLSECFVVWYDNGKWPCASRKRIDASLEDDIRYTDWEPCKRLTNAQKKTLARVKEEWNTLCLRL